ncbi:MAG TPA: sensor histidine kinase, partial [Rhodanobacter sp.]|nr:sensor histidine kinase [Rhodanobacter sp.]
NAVRHGVQPLREGGEVVLRGQRDGTGVRIEIINPLPVTPPAAGNGHGLDSVRRRVAYRYGPLAKVQAGPQDDRFVVLLQLPGGSA